MRHEGMQDQRTFRNGDLFKRMVGQFAIGCEVNGTPASINDQDTVSLYGKLWDQSISRANLIYSR